MQQKLQESEAEIDLLIKRYEDVKSNIANKRQEIIEEHIESRILEEGLFRLKPVTKKENRKVNIQKIKTDYPEKFKTLLKMKLDDIEGNYVPTIKECEVVFKKQVDEVLIPAGEKIVGYELKTVISPEKAGSVEP
jgi:hypothetical protein